MAKKPNAKASDGLVAAGAADKLELTARPDESSGRTLARVTLDPLARHANLAVSFGSAMFGDSHRRQSLKARLPCRSMSSAR